MRRLCFSFSHLDAQLRWLSSSAHHNYRLGFRAQHRMRATGISDRTSTKLADDWTEALEGTPSRNKDSNGNTGHGPSRQCAPPLGNNDFAELQNPPFPKSVGSEPEMAQYGNAEMLLLSPHVIHYPSFIERGELAALLDAREEQAALFDPSPGSEAPRATAFIPTAASPVHNSGLHSAAAVNGAVEIPRAVVAATAASRAATAGTGGIGSTSVNVTEDDRCFKETATAADAVTAPPQPAIATVARSLSAGRASRCGRNTDRILVAIELGSHCTRALLHDGRSELARLTYDTMLGQNVSQQGGDSNRGEEIHPDALERTLGALQQIMAKVIASAAAVPPSPPSTVESQAAVTAMEPVEAVLPSRSVGHPHIIARMVATAAVRNASISSKAALVAAAERLTGCSLEILTGEDEGRLAWRGVVCGLQGRTQPRQHYIGAAQATTPNEAAASVCHHYNHQQQQQHLLIVDLGGRSTELVYGVHKADKPAAVSVPLGCVSLHTAACELEQSSASVRNRMMTAARRPGATGGGGNGDQVCGSALSVPVPGPEDVEPSLEALEACVRLAQQTIQRLCSGMPWMPPKGPMAATTTGASAAAANFEDAARNPRPMDTQTPSAGGSNDYCAAAAADCAPPSSLPSLVQNCSAEEIATTTVIFTGGTVTTLAALHQRLPCYDRARVHGSALTFGDIAALMVHLADAEWRAAALRTYCWLTEARCRTLAAGCAGLLGVMAALRLERVAVSDADILDGLLAEILDSYTVLR